MRDRDPAATLLQPTLTFFGRGRLTRGEHQTAVAFSLTGRPFHPGEDWDVEVYAVGDDAGDWEPLFGSDGTPVQLQGTTQDGRTLVLPALYAKQATATRLVATAWDVRVGDVAGDAVLEPPTEQHVTVFLTPTSMALPRPDFLLRSYTGELTPVAEDRTERPAVVVGTSVGDAELRLTYAWEDAQVAGASADLRIPTPTLQLAVAREAISADAHAAMAAVDHALADTLDVLSLLSWRFVRWTRMALRSYWYDGDQPRDVRDSEWLRTIGASRDARESRELVNAHRMPADALNRLVATYGADPRKHALRAALTYCLASYEARALETSFLGAFTAVEAFNAAVADAGPVGEDGVDYDELHARLTQTVVAYAEERAAPREVAEALAARVGDLHPRPRAKLKKGGQIAEMVRTTGVRWDDLWPNGTVLADAMRCAFHRRNVFYHQGRFPDAETALVDAGRLRLLCDRMLRARVGVDPDWQANQWEDDSRARRLAAHPV